MGDDRVRRQKSIGGGQFTLIPSADDEFERRDLRDSPLLGEGIDILACRFYALRNVNQDIAVNQVRHVK